jgi:hypothetical protein
VRLDMKGNGVLERGMLRMGMGTMNGTGDTLPGC